MNSTVGVGVDLVEVIAGVAKEAVTVAVAV